MTRSRRRVLFLRSILVVQIVSLINRLFHCFDVLFLFYVLNSRDFSLSMIFVENWCVWRFYFGILIQIGRLNRCYIEYLRLLALFSYMQSIWMDLNVVYLRVESIVLNITMCWGSVLLDQVMVLIIFEETWWYKIPPLTGDNRGNSNASRIISAQTSLPVFQLDISWFSTITVGSYLGNICRF